jgi:hypothetical protein
LPSRDALVTRLEAQRAELVRAMSDVNLARFTIEQHVDTPPFGGESPETLEEHGLYRQRVLEVLADAAQALRTAYPTLERIAQALAVEEILKWHMPTLEASASNGAGAASTAGPSERGQNVR